MTLPPRPALGPFLPSQRPSPLRLLHPLFQRPCAAPVVCHSAHAHAPRPPFCGLPAQFDSMCERPIQLQACPSPCKLLLSELCSTRAAPPCRRERTARAAAALALSCFSEAKNPPPAHLSPSRNSLTSSKPRRPDTEAAAPAGRGSLRPTSQCCPRRPVCSPALWRPAPGSAGRRPPGASQLRVTRFVGGGGRGGGGRAGLPTHAARVLTTDTQL